MPKLTLSQAARAAGKSKTQISRMVERGRISAEKADDGRVLIDLSELRRIYPEADPTVSRLPRTGDGEGDKRNDPVTAAFQAQIALLENERDRLRGELDGERRDRAAERDRLLGLVEVAQRQIADQRERRPWWRIGR